MAETNQSDSCIFPYETRGMLDFLRWYFGSLSLALRCFPHAITVDPPVGGISSFTITASWLRLTDMVTTLSMEAL